MFMIISLNYINHCIRGGNKIVLDAASSPPRSHPKKPFSAHLPVTFAAAPRWFSSPPVSLRHPPNLPPLLVVHRRGEITSGELTPPRSPPTLPLYVAIAVSFTSPNAEARYFIIAIVVTTLLSRTGEPANTTIAITDQSEIKEVASITTGSAKEPEVGMEFESDEAAKTFYNEYARRLGFPFRVGRSRRSKGVEEVLIMKRFVCSKEGVYRKKTSGECTRKRERISMREGCKAMMEVVRDSNRWVISKLEKNHNHHLGTCSRVGYLRARGFIDNSDKATIVASDAMALFRQNAFGEGGDAQGLLDYFKKMQAENPNFFYAIQVENNSCVTNAFWADARARTAYRYFGDAVTFDTTYKKNKYMMPFVTFSGVNHHLQPVIFGCALLVDETEFSFIWLFETWLAAMGGQAPFISFRSESGNGSGNC
uniref:Uncharacterized protein n=1 Tax=Ananas comosus var. bracteatus TaxID=296719 RepID=A0A6V7NMD6_ANACO|nr:unnamed protein product [Ananas comosus var. bracteatus]